MQMAQEDTTGYSHVHFGNQSAVFRRRELTFIGAAHSGDEPCPWSEGPTEKQPGADECLWEHIMLVH